MAGDARRFVLWMGLALRDDAGYARYRAAMRPILASYGGRFDCDLRVREVLAGPGTARIDRAFALSFPDRAHRERFFDDPDYQRVRAQWFEPSVEAITPLGEFEAFEPIER
jgi:uncharacterized protein (DUF1330 family)